MNTDNSKEKICSCSDCNDKFLWNKDTEHTVYSPRNSKLAGRYTLGVICDTCYSKREEKNQEEIKERDLRVAKEKEDADKRYRLAIEEQRTLLANAPLLCFPKRFESKLFSDFVQSGNQSEITKAINAVKNNQSLFISGECGRGKTHLAVALAREWFLINMRIPEFWVKYQDSILRFENWPLFLPAVEFFLEIKTTFNSDCENENSVIEKYATAQLLIIDDIGAEKVSDWSRQVFYTLLDRRYRDMKQTIITSNLSLSELAKQIDVRITSRILEMGVAITLTGNDYRLKAHGVSNG